MTAQAGGASLLARVARFEFRPLRGYAPDAVLRYVESMTPSRDDIRRAARAQRRLVPPRTRALAARSFATIADRERLLRTGRRVAVYQPYGHEADVTRLSKRALERGCLLYVPVITHIRRSRMQFVRLRPGMPLRKNRFGIDEPIFSVRDVVSALRLDLVFMPLVAFDARGWRLGSGAGFYDRCFQRLGTARSWRRPRLIGVGYRAQQVATVSPHRWDVPLDAVLTEAELIRFTTNAWRTS